MRRGHRLETAPSNHLELAVALTFDISWIAVLVATVVGGALGALYFTALVPRQYAVVMGRQDAPKHSQPASAYVGQVVATALVAATTAVLLASLGIETLGAALGLGLLIGVGFLSAMTLNIAINPNFPHPFRYTLLNAPYFVVGSLVTSAVLVLVP